MRHSCSDDMCLLIDVTSVRGMRFVWYVPHVFLFLLRNHEFVLHYALSQAPTVAVLNATDRWFPVVFFCRFRSIVASKTNEGMDVAHHFVSPLVLRSLVDKLTSYQAPAVTGTAEGNNRVSKYGRTPGSVNVTPASEEEAAEEVAVPPPTVVEDLVIKLLACLMVHPQQGQRARLVLRDEVPENVYMALHRAGSVPADIKGDSVTAQPPPPHRDTDHKLYPKKGNAAAGAAGAEPVFATGGAKAPESLARPLSIFINPVEEETAPVTVKNVEDAVIKEEDVEPSVSVSEASHSQSPTRREGSLRRSVVSVLKSQRTTESSRLPSVAASSASGTDAYGGGGAGAGTPNGKGKGMWQRASVSWAKSSLNPVNGGNGDVYLAKAAAKAEAVDVVNEERPLTLPVSSPKPDPLKARTLSMRALATRLSPKPVLELSPANSGSTKGRSMRGWGSSSVASTSPGKSVSPKPNDGRRGF